jgi:hypothetical protein
MTLRPSSPTLRSHSASITLPTRRMSAISCSEGLWIVIPLAVSCSLYQRVFSSEVFQPRASASAAALSTAACVALSSASNALTLTMTAFLGSHARVS